MISNTRSRSCQTQDGAAGKPRIAHSVHAADGLLRPGMAATATAVSAVSAVSAAAMTTAQAAPPTAACAALLASGAGALFDEGDLRASRRWFEQAYRIADHLGDAPAMAAAVLGLAGLWVHEHRTAAAGELGRARVRRVLSLLDPQSALALRLRIRLAGELDYCNGEHAAILALLQQARQAADPVTRVEALSLAHHCLLGPEHGAARQALAAELISESHHSARRGDLLMGLLWQTVDLFLDAQPHAERRLAELRNLLVRRDYLAVSFVVSAIDVMLAIRAGQFDQAEALAQECAKRGAVAGDVDATGWHGAQLVAIRWFQGRLGELLPMLAEMVNSPTLSAVDNSYFAATAVAAALTGDRRKAAGILARLCGNDLADLPRSSTWLVTMNGIVETAYLLGDADIAARAYELLSPFAELPVVVSLGVACFGSAQHALGVAALTAGDVDRAVEHLRTAVERNLAMAHWPAVMMSRLRYAQALARRAQPQDAAAARHELDTAEQEAAALGITLPHLVRPVAAQPPVLTATRQGNQWRLDWGRRSVIVEHSVGMLHLAVLIANPGQEIAAIDLVSGVAALGNAAAGANVSAQPVLDQVAVHKYRHRLALLSAEIDDLEARNDAAGCARARAERDWLMAELAGASGLGGRTRRFSDDDERARIAVGKAIRRTLARIEAADTFTGEHLRTRVQTGVRCSYRPS
jgi:hypothetical protein